MARINQCHTLSRIDFETCSLVKEYYNKVQFKTFIFDNHHLIQKNNICVKGTILFDFYNHESLENKLSSKSNYMSLSILALLLLFFI